MLNELLKNVLAKDVAEQVRAAEPAKSSRKAESSHKAGSEATEFADEVNRIISAESRRAAGTEQPAARQKSNRRNDGAAAAKKISGAESRAATDRNRNVSNNNEIRKHVAVSEPAAKEFKVSGPGEVYAAQYAPEDAAPVIAIPAIATYKPIEGAELDVRNNQASELIGSALAKVSSTLNLPSAVSFDEQSLIKFDQDTLEQFAEILHALESIGNLLDKVAVSNEVLDFDGMNISADDAALLSADLRVEKFHIQMGLSMIGAREIVSDIMGDKYDAQLPASGISQAADPASLGMSVIDTARVFGSLTEEGLTAAEEGLTAAIERIKLARNGQAGNTAAQNTQASVELAAADSREMRETFKASAVNAKVEDIDVKINNNVKTNNNVKIDNVKNEDIGVKIDKIDVNVEKVGVNNVKIDVNNVKIDVPQSLADIPQSLADVPQSLADIPQSLADIPQSLADIPQSLADIPQSHADVPQSHADIPQSLADVPQDTADVKIDNAEPENVKAENVKFEQVKPEQVKADDVNVNNVKADNVNINNVKPEQVKADDINVNSVKADNVNINNVKPEQVKVDDVNVNSVKPEQVKVDDVNVNSVKADNVNINNVKPEQVKVDDVDVNNVKAENANVNNVKTDNVKAEDVDSDNETPEKPEQVKVENVKVDNVKAEDVKIEQVKAENIKDVKLEQVKAENIKAQDVDGVKPENVKAKVDIDKPEPVKAENVNPEYVRVWSGKPQNAKGENEKPEPVKPENVKPETARIFNSINIPLSVSELANANKTRETKTEPSDAKYAAGLAGVSIANEEAAVSAKSEKSAFTPSGALLQNTAAVSESEGAEPRADIVQADIAQAKAQAAVEHVEKASTAFSRVDHEEVIRQITEKMHHAVRNGVQEVRMVLRPEALGEVRMSLRVEGDVVMARIQVENSQVKAIVESRLQDLKDSLEQQNLQAGAFSVDVGAGKDRSPREAWQDLAEASRLNSKFREGGIERDGLEEAGAAGVAAGSDTGRRFGNNTFELFI